MLVGRGAKANNFFFYANRLVRTCRRRLMPTADSQRGRYLLLAELSSHSYGTGRLVTSDQGDGDSIPVMAKECARPFCFLYVLYTSIHSR